MLQVLDLAPELVRQVKDRRRNQSTKNRKAESPTLAERTRLCSPVQGTARQGSGLRYLLEAS